MLQSRVSSTSRSTTSPRALASLCPCPSLRSQLATTWAQSALHYNCPWIFLKYLKIRYHSILFPRWYGNFLILFFRPPVRRQSLLENKRKQLKIRSQNIKKKQLMESRLSRAIRELKATRRFYLLFLSFSFSFANFLLSPSFRAYYYLFF